MLCRLLTLGLLAALSLGTVPENQSPTATINLEPGSSWYRWKVNGELELPFLLRVES